MVYSSVDARQYLGANAVNLPKDDAVKIRHLNNI